MSLYSMEDARQEGAMGLSDMFLRDWAQGQTTRKCTISGQSHQRCAIWALRLPRPARPGWDAPALIPRFMPRRHKKVGPKADSLHTITGAPYLRYLPSAPTLPGPFSTQTRAE